MKKKYQHTFAHALPKKAATLALCMIVKNEAENLGPCLESIRPALDEIIVVDTGSSDNTKAIAQQYGARVFDLPWANDFSAARNASIEHATSDYILWLDADDRIEPSELAKIKQFKYQLPLAKNQAYFLTIRNQFIGEADIAFTQLRIFPNVPTARFEFQIHEQISEKMMQSGVALLQADIAIDHTGYHDPETVKKKSVRNLEIIQAELTKHPDNPFMHLQLARTLGGIGRQAEAIPHMRQVWHTPNLLTQQRRLYILAGMQLGRYCNELAEYTEAETVLRQLIQNCPEEELAHYLLSESLLGQKKYHEAATALNRSLAKPLVVGVFPLNLSLVRFNQRFFLGLAYKGLGEFAQAQEWLEKSLGIVPDDFKSMLELGALALQAGHYPQALAYYEQGVNKAKQHAGAANYANLGLAYRKSGRVAEAEAAWQKALTLHPTLIEALVPLGYLYWEQQKTELALAMFQKAQTQDTELTDVKLALAKIYWHRQDVGQTIQQCGSLLKELALTATDTLQGLPDLAALFALIGQRFTELHRHELARCAWELSFLIHPSPTVLTDLLTGAAAKSSLGVIEESLQQHQGDAALLQSLQAALQTQPVP